MRATFVRFKLSSDAAVNPFHGTKKPQAEAQGSMIAGRTIYPMLDSGSSIKVPAINIYRLEPFCRNNCGLDNWIGI
jgi:hypothetical protein